MKLKVRPQTGPEREVELEAERIVAGRDEACDLVLDDDKASRQHAAFERLPDGAYQVVDLGSTNGTFVGDERITGPVRLTGGEEVRIGSTVLAVEAPAPVGAPATVIAGAPATIVGEGATPTPTPSAPPPPPPPPITPSRIMRMQQGLSRWKWAAIGGGIAALGGLGAALALVFTGGSSTQVVTLPTAPPVTFTTTVVLTETAAAQPSTEGTTPASTDQSEGSTDTQPSGDAPTEAEAALLTHVPDAISSKCGRLSAPQPGSTARVVCDGPSGTRIIYFQFESADAMQSWYSGWRGRDTPDTGDCVKDNVAEGTWSDNGQPGGRLDCTPIKIQDTVYRAIGWTGDAQAIGAVVFLAGDDQQTRQTVFNDWQNAGPK